jgi:N-methylhydantoinase B/oxoprolinase/acetone carboxylase alpha subunit
VGRRAFADGNSAVIVPNGNCRNTPVEVFETRYPFLTHTYRLVPDSPGPGTHRGGLGTQRVIEVLPPAEITVSAVFERLKVSPWGLFGGGPANHAAILVRKRGDTAFRTFKEVYHTTSPAKFANCVVSPGDQILLQAPGGGGYGDPLERPPEAVLRDIDQGLISADRGRGGYGVATRMERSRPALDPEGTTGLRAGMRAARAGAGSA